MKRIITALVLIPVVVWVVLAAPAWTLLLLMAAVGLIAFHEFDTIAGAQGVAKSGWFGLAAGLIFLFTPDPAWVTLVILALAFMALELRQADLSKAMTGAAAALSFVPGVSASSCCADAERSLTSVAATRPGIEAPALVVTVVAVIEYRPRDVLPVAIRSTAPATSPPSLNSPLRV